MVQVPAQTGFELQAELLGRVCDADQLYHTRHPANTTEYHAWEAIRRVLLPETGANELNHTAELTSLQLARNTASLAGCSSPGLLQPR